LPGHILPPAHPRRILGHVSHFMLLISFTTARPLAAPCSSASPHCFPFKEPPRDSPSGE
jgi:hypothetical protein